MEKVYLNELSLDGQFNDMDDFFEHSMPVIQCMKYLKENEIKIYKSSSFYKCRITEDKTLHDLKGVRTDRARRFKSLLLSTTQTPPFWDLDPDTIQQLDAEYVCGDKDVSCTSVAEAAETGDILLSFYAEEYIDKILKILKNKKTVYDVNSVFSTQYLAEVLYQRKEIDIKMFLQMKYKGTRLDFTYLEDEYGFDDFQKGEIKECLDSFERFVTYKNWNDILNDHRLCYKKYDPSSRKDDWFSDPKYAEYTIDKFRCVNPKRCFGYREKDIFYVLRMERDHKISDNG